MPNYCQEIFRKNSNILANKLPKSLLNTSNLNGGVCFGLSKQYIAYTKRQEREDFFNLLGFINSLTEEDISIITETYKNKKKI